MNSKEKIEEILENIDRRLLLLETKEMDDATARKIVIDDILYNEVNKLKQLLKYMNLK